MYQVLYRKWRPRTFADVIGQEHITTTLSRELMAGRIAHAYLFTGSRGTGKTTCAKILAKAVNCLDPQNGNPCNLCSNCEGIDNGTILDVLEIDAASNNGVDNIRDIRDETLYTPSVGKYRVYIIDEVHMLSINAFNALLKTLEEPPPHVIFILATTELHKLPATILSRCQRFDFRRINASEIANRLVYIAEQEGVKLHNSAALLIAKLSDGAMRDALSMLDQCMGNKDITEEVVINAAGLAGKDYLFSLADAIRASDTGNAIDLIEKIHKASKDMARLCEELISFYRNLMIIKTVKNYTDLIVASNEELGMLKDEASRHTLSEILYAIDIFAETAERMQKSGNRRVSMEMAVIRLCIPELDISTDAILKRLSRLEEAVKHGTFTATPVKGNRIVDIKTPDDTNSASNKPNSPNKKPSQNSTEPKKEDNNFEILRNTSPDNSQNPTESFEGKLTDNKGNLICWPEVVGSLPDEFAPLKGLLNCTTAKLKGDTLYIESNNPVLESMLRRESHKNALVNSLIAKTGEKLKFGGLIQEQDPEEHDLLSDILSKAKSAGIKVNDN